MISVESSKGLVPSLQAGSAGRYPVPLWEGKAVLSEGMLHLIPGVCPPPLTGDVTAQPQPPPAPTPSLLRPLRPSLSPRDKPAGG